MLPAPDPSSLCGPHELCLGLHAMGFTVPRLSPDGRCALTAPFHPYLCPASRAIGGLFSVALSLAPSRTLAGVLGRVGVTHHRVLSCSDFPPMSSLLMSSRLAASCLNSTLGNFGGIDQAESVEIP